MTMTKTNSTAPSASRRGFLKTSATFSGGLMVGFTLPLGGPAHVLATTGLRWPLQDETLAFGPARGVSNEMTDAVATVRLGAGVVLCVQVRQLSVIS